MAEQPTIPPHTTGNRTPMTVDAMIALIRRHLALFRHDPQFVNYIVNLSLYLLEVQDGRIAVDQLPEPHPGKAPQATPHTMARLAEAAKRPVTDTCPVCGASTRGRRMCPNCGHMVG